jgi:hypothetical protein
VNEPTSRSIKLTDHQARERARVYSSARRGIYIHAFARRINDKEAILVGVLILLQGSVTSVLHIWPENDISREKDFVRRRRESVLARAYLSRIVLVPSVKRGYQHVCVHVQQ